MMSFLCAMIAAKDAYEMVRNGTYVFIYVTDSNVNDTNLTAFARVARNIIVPTSVISCSEIEQFCDNINFHRLPQAVLFNGVKRIATFVGKWSTKQLKNFVYENGVFNVERMLNVSLSPNMLEFLVLRINSKRPPESVYELAYHVHVFYSQQAYDQQYESSGYGNGGVRDIDVWLNSNGNITRYDDEYSLHGVLQWLERVRDRVL